MVLATVFSNAVLQLWQFLIGAFAQSFGQVALEFPWRRPAGTQGPILQIEVATRSHASDRTELRKLPDWQGTVPATLKQTRQPGDRTEESSSLIPDEHQANNRCSKGETLRPSVAIKGCLPKGSYPPIAFLPQA